MKILQIVSTWKGGPIRVVSDVAKALNNRGHKATVYATNLVEEDYDFVVDNVHTLHTLCPPLARKTKLYCTPEAISLFKNIRCFDILHLHEYRTFQNIIVHYFAKKYGIPYVLQAHGSLPRTAAKAKLKLAYDVLFGYRLLRDASKVIALNQMEAEQYRDMGVPEEKITVIPNGIDIPAYADLPPKGFFKKRFNIDEDEKIVLYLGRIHRIKGIDILTKAFANIVKELNDVKLVVVGPDDGYLGELRKLTKALKIGDDVLILGPLYSRDKLGAYVDADVYVLPSRYETFPITVLEAVACGTPIILTENCDLAAHLKDKVGLAVKPSSKDLLMALRTVLLDKGRQDLFRVNSKNVIRKFSISKMVDRLERVYKQLRRVRA